MTMNGRGWLIDLLLNCQYM